jgi:hypothetical protein
MAKRAETPSVRFAIFMITPALFLSPNACSKAFLQALAEVR